MTDGLVKEAREMASTQSDLSPYDCYDDSDLLTKLADRIEELEERLAEALNQLDSTRHSVDVLERRVGELKAKLKGTNA